MFELYLYLYIVCGKCTCPGLEQLSSVLSIAATSPMESIECLYRLAVSVLGLNLVVGYKAISY